MKRLLVLRLLNLFSYSLVWSGLQPYSSLLQTHYSGAEYTYLTEVEYFKEANTFRPQTLGHNIDTVAYAITASWAMLMDDRQLYPPSAIWGTRRSFRKKTVLQKRKHYSLNISLKKTVTNIGKERLNTVQWTFPKRLSFRFAWIWQEINQ